jgi:hypothetical protein
VRPLHARLPDGNRHRRAGRPGAPRHRRRLVPHELGRAERARARAPARRDARCRRSASSGSTSTTSRSPDREKADVLRRLFDRIKKYPDSWSRAS